MADLKTDYKDDILVSGQQRKYNLIENSDGTVSLVDVSSYAQYGDTLKAEDFNATNAAVNALNGKTDGLEGDIAEVDGKVALNTTVPAPIASSGGSTVALEWTHSEGDTSEYLYFIVDGTPVAKIRGMTRIG